MKIISIPKDSSISLLLYRMLMVLMCFSTHAVYAAGEGEEEFKEQNEVAHCSRSEPLSVVEPVRQLEQALAPSKRPSKAQLDLGRAPLVSLQMLVDDLMDSEGETYPGWPEEEGKAAPKRVSLSQNTKWVIQGMGRLSERFSAPYYQRILQAMKRDRSIGEIPIQPVNERPVILTPETAWLFQDMPGLDALPADGSLALISYPVHPNAFLPISADLIEETYTKHIEDLKKTKKELLESQSKSHEPSVSAHLKKEFARVVAELEEDSAQAKIRIGRQLKEPVSFWLTQEVNPKHYRGKYQISESGEEKLKNILQFRSDWYDDYHTVIHKGDEEKKRTLKHLAQHGVPQAQRHLGSLANFEKREVYAKQAFEAGFPEPQAQVVDQGVRHAENEHHELRHEENRPENRPEENRPPEIREIPGRLEPIAFIPGRIPEEIARFLPRFIQLPKATSEEVAHFKRALPQGQKTRIQQEIPAFKAAELKNSIGLYRATMRRYPDLRECYNPGKGRYYTAEEMEDQYRLWDAHPRLPLVCTTVEEDKAFARELSRLTGRNFKIMSDVQNEYSIRGRTAQNEITTSPYYFGRGGENDPLEKHAFVPKNPATQNRSHEVDEIPAGARAEDYQNSYKLIHPIGNVYTRGFEGVIRGGSFRNVWFALSSQSLVGDEHCRFGDIGSRLAEVN